MAKISKLQAARQQLDCAIRLFFNNDDLLSAITLSRAAFRILYDIYPAVRQDGFHNDVDEVIGEFGWGRFNRASNYLKHADKDPGEEADILESEAVTGIAFATILYRRCADRFSPEMLAWEAYMAVVLPDIYVSRIESVPQLVVLVEKYKDASREQKLALGRSFLADTKSLPGNEEGFSTLFLPNAE